MTKEKQFFLNVLSDYINRCSTTPPTGLDWQQIISYATHHQLCGVIWHQCRTFLSNSDEYQHIYKDFQLAAFANSFYYANNVYAYQELESNLRNNQICFFSVKGLDVAALFPVPCYRTMGDIDIIVSEKDKTRISNIMDKLGYQLVKQDNELIYKRGNVNLEIHEHLIYKQNQERAIIKKYFDNCWNYINVDKSGKYILNWNFHFVFLIEHLKKHFSGNGIGFRQFMDIAVVSKEIADLNWDVIEDDLRKLGLWEFTLNVFSFIHKWFHITPPIDIMDIDDDFYEESTELVFSNGVFGFSNENHKEHAIERRIRASSLPRPLSKIRIVLKEVFIPYKDIIELPYCQFLRGKKYLLPFAWIYRVFYVIIKKQDLLQKKRDLLFNSEVVLLRHHKLMKRWGI